MNRKQKICLWIGIVAIVAMGLYPPWVLEHEKKNIVGSWEGRRFEYKYITEPGTYSWLNDPPKNAKFVDLYRLGIQYFIVAVATTGLILIFRGRSIGTVVPDALKVNQTKKPAKKLMMFIFFLCVATLFFVLGATFNYYVNRDKPQIVLPKSVELEQSNNRNKDWLEAAKRKIVQKRDWKKFMDKVYQEYPLEEPNQPRRVDLSDLVKQAKNSEPNKQ